MRPYMIIALALTLVACTNPSHENIHSKHYPASGTVKVAAVQYAEGDYAKVDPACGSAQNKDICALSKLIEQAVAQGAVLVVTPENESGQQYLEPDPTLGEDPGNSSKWTDKHVTKALSKQAKKLGAYVVTHLQTYSGSDPNITKYSSQIALGPKGTVVGKHHKFELYGGEKDSFEPGKDVMTFDTPAGKVGMLICADMYGDLRMSDKLTRVNGARVVAVSTWWTVPDGTKWQENYAKNWGVYVVAAGSTYSAGRGGGVYEPNGNALVRYVGADPKVTIAEIPAP